MAIDFFFLGVIAITLLLVIVLVIYLVGRMNDLEKETRSVASKISEANASNPANQGPFAGLNEKKLWDAMTGKAVDGVSGNLLEDVRLRYEPVLSKHIESLFEEGRLDAQMGVAASPENVKRINVLRGVVDSWLPPAQCNTIYQCGVDLVQKTADQRPAIRQALDEACKTLYERAQFELKQPFSDVLMGPVEAPSAPNSDNSTDAPDGSKPAV